mgnify:FL=1
MSTYDVAFAQVPAGTYGREKRRGREMRTEAEIRAEIAEVLALRTNQHLQGWLDALRWVLIDRPIAPLNGEPRKTRATGRSHE